MIALDVSRDTFDSRDHSHSLQGVDFIQNEGKLLPSYCAAVIAMNLTKLWPAELERDANELD